MDAGHEAVPIAVGVSVGQRCNTVRGSKAFPEKSAAQGLHAYGETMATVGCRGNHWRVDMDYFLTLKAILYI